MKLDAFISELRSFLLKEGNKEILITQSLGAVSTLREPFLSHTVIKDEKGELVPCLVIRGLSAEKHLKKYTTCSK